MQVQQRLPLYVPGLSRSAPGPGRSQPRPPERPLSVPPGARAPACCRGGRRLLTTAWLPLSLSPRSQVPHLEPMGALDAILPVGSVRAPAGALWEPSLPPGNPRPALGEWTGEVKIKRWKVFQEPWDQLFYFAPCLPWGSSPAAYPQEEERMREGGEDERKKENRSIWRLESV